jgi:hypothetical protein
MCGSTGQQNSVEAADMQTMQEYDTMLQQQYGNQQAIYGKVSSVLDPILRAGPSQQGFSTAEKNTLDAQAVGGTAQNYSQAAKAVGAQIGAEGGGNSVISSGANEELRAEVAESAAQNESNEEAQITAQDYATGRQNFQNAEQGEFEIASGDNPLGYGSLENTAESNTGSEANSIAQENNSWYTAALGAAGEIGGAVVGENPGGIFGP